MQCLIWVPYYLKPHFINSEAKLLSPFLLVTHLWVKRCRGQRESTGSHEFARLLSDRTAMVIRQVAVLTCCHPPWEPAQSSHDVPAAWLLLWELSLVTVSNIFILSIQNGAMQTSWEDQESITIKAFKMGVSSLEEHSGDNTEALLLQNAPSWCTWWQGGWKL